MEVEKTMIDFVVPIEDKMQGIIKVVGVGGGDVMCHGTVP